MLLSSHHPTLLTHLSRTYLTPIEGCPAFWQILERARERRTGDTLAWSGQEGIEISMDWTDCKGAIVQVLVRKAVGGTRAITRNLSALATSASGLKTVPLSELVQVNPMPGPGNGDARGGQRETEMDVPFNLSLTEEQRRRRGEVPLPYAHEGEGVGVGVGLDWDDEDDEDDEEI